MAGGQQVGTATGTLGVAKARALSAVGEFDGLSIFRGTLTASQGSDRTQNVTGEAFATGQGTLTAKAFTGKEFAAFAGFLTPDVQEDTAIIVSQGSLTISAAVALAGELIGAADGTLVVTGDRAAALTGEEATLADGTLTAVAVLVGQSIVTATGTVGSLGGTPVEPPSVDVGGGGDLQGRPGARRRKKQVVLEVDGQSIVVAEDDAERVLEALEAAALEKARAATAKAVKAAKKALKRGAQAKPIALEVPKVSAEDAAFAQPFQDVVTQAYERAMDEAQQAVAQAQAQVREDFARQQVALQAQAQAVEDDDEQMVAVLAQELDQELIDKMEDILNELERFMKLIGRNGPDRTR